MKKIIVFGGASAIAAEVEKLFAAEGAELCLLDTKMTRLEAVRNDILARYKTRVELIEFNALDFNSHKEVFFKAVETLGGVDIVLVTYGTLPNQEKAQHDTDYAIEHFNINATSVISLCSIVANYFEEKHSGTLAVISSVAGDRGRKSNYLYGSAKGAVSLFLQGLRNRLSSKNVSVITIKPGIVDTPMTAHLPKNFLFAKVDVVGRIIFEGINAQKDIIYVPGYWRLIMCLIKHIPETIFKRLNL
ncbi:MAG: SDR family oxidoreductase [Bacteroidota bacterium]